MQRRVARCREISPERVRRAIQVVSLSAHYSTVTGLAIAFGEIAVGLGALLGLWLSRCTGRDSRPRLRRSHDRYRPIGVSQNDLQAGGGGRDRRCPRSPPQSGSDTDLGRPPLLLPIHLPHRNDGGVGSRNSPTTPRPMPTMPPPRTACLAVPPLRSSARTASPSPTGPSPSVRTSKSCASMWASSPTGSANLPTPDPTSHSPWPPSSWVAGPGADRWPSNRLSRWVADG
jgi:hypothetical protein